MNVMLAVSFHLDTGESCSLIYLPDNTRNHVVPRPPASKHPASRLGRSALATARVRVRARRPDTTIQMSDWYHLLVEGSTIPPEESSEAA